MIEIVAIVLLVAVAAVAMHFIWRTAADARAMRRDFQATRGEAQEQVVALRKQAKIALKDIQRIAAQVERIADKQYRQQKDVDDILYHAAREREKANG